MILEPRIECECPSTCLRMLYLHRAWWIGFCDMLRRDHTAHVGHFGSVRVAKFSQRTLVTTLGFVDPEYGVTGKLTEKSDVFSYGMLLLVLVSGRRMLASHPSGNELFQPIPQAESALSALNKAKIRTHLLPEIGRFARFVVPKCVVLHSTSLIPLF